MLSGSGSVVYGPFHRRRNQNTQSDAVALEQQQSQEIWGVAARWSPFRSVKAYRGQLPAGSQGIEFMTAVMRPAIVPTTSIGMKALRACRSTAKVTR